MNKPQSERMQIPVCTVEGAPQTNLQAVLPFWTAEELSSTLLLQQ